ncbi:MAG: ribosome assembly RNA-binding protein YhbY [Gammaproteobacteria bacterium]|nr:ribosome assembly RNA-binding protein YhbY [Gammaproteobacteria bacterium]|tara:strand:- start:60 stop:395 length:336 start_codon:yes stop_codon:yes gene_type:complete
MSDQSSQPKILTNTEKKRLRAIGHALKPLVTIGQNGLTRNVGQEINRALEDHELIKIKMHIPDREMRRALIKNVCSVYHAESVQDIGHTSLLYRVAKRPDPKLSNLIRKVS